MYKQNQVYTICSWRFGCTSTKQRSLRAARRPRLFQHLQTNAQEVKTTSEQDGDPNSSLQNVVYENSAASVGFAARTQGTEWSKLKQQQ